MLDQAFAEQFLQRYGEITPTRDIDAWLSQFTEDVVFDDAGAESAVVGRDQLGRFWQPLLDAMEHMESTVVQAFIGVDAPTVALLVRDRVKHRDHDAPLISESFEIYEFRGEKICRWTLVVRHMGWMGEIIP